MKILITGGCGYVGTVLTEKLLRKGMNVTVVDTQWFGNYLTEHKNLLNIKEDIRNIDTDFLKSFNVVIHLANIANDPSVDLNPTLSWEVNVLAMHQLADYSVRAGVNQFIYASSGSVYGIKEEPNVTEDLTLVPISVYNKTKMVAERVLLSYKNEMSVHCIRPATVCGWSPRMRLDVSVNMLTMQALKNKRITVFGGTQTRPNIHIKDLVLVYEHFLENPEIESGCYNAGFENISILDIANTINSIIPSEIIISESNDPRSYRQDSTKLLKTGYKQNFYVKDAISEIIAKYKDGLLEDKPNFYTVNWMKKLNLNK